MPRPPYNFAGTPPGEVSGIDPVRKELIKHPRHRHFAVVELCSVSDTRHHSDEEGTTVTVVLQIMDCDVITIQDDINSLSEIRARARSERPGQATLDDQAHGGEWVAPTGAPPPEGGVPLTPEEIEASQVAAAKGQVVGEDQARADELAARRRAD